VRGDDMEALRQLQLLHPAATRLVYRDVRGNPVAYVLVYSSAE
jgi:hypothetical protein